MEDTRVERLRKLHTALLQDRASWETHWREIADHMLPRRLRLQSSERNRGDRRNQKIIDGTATRSIRNATAGLSSGITSPARPWFKLGAPDPELGEFGPVKRWLEDCTKRMRALFLRSNFYQITPATYRDLLTFGTGAYAALEDDDDIVRFYSFAPGTYAVAVNHRNVVDTFVRRVSMTVHQLVEEFGEKDAGPNTRWEPFSQQVKDAYERGNFFQTIDVIHAVYPNEEHEPRLLDSKHKRFASCYFEETTPDRHKLLRERGYDTYPIICPRWDVTDTDVYGTSPGMDALGDVKALQILQKRKAQAIEKMVNPPLMGPAALRQQKVSMLPGDVTYLDVREGQQGLKPVHEVRFDVAGVLEDVREHQRRISEAFYEDLFLMVAQMERSGVTATEINERREEKLLALGPTLERLNDEMLEPTIDRIFPMMEQAGLIPPPPQELLEAPLQIEYVSIMAQAQKIVGAASLERFFGVAGNLAAVFPQVLDVVDADAGLREYADVTSAPPKVVRDEDAVKAMREDRAKQQQAAQAAENLATAAKGAQLLSQVDTSRPNAVTGLANALQ